MKWLIPVVAIVFFIAGYLAGQDASRPSRRPVSIYQARLAEAILAAQKVPDTVYVAVAKVKTLRDTLNIRDTVQVKEFVERTDTLIERCLVCAAAVETVTVIHRLMPDPPACPSHRLGVWAGYGATKDGTVVRAGWQVGAGVRVLPWR